MYLTDNGKALVLNGGWMCTFLLQDEHALSFLIYRTHTVQRQGYSTHHRALAEGRTSPEAHLEYNSGCAPFQSTTAMAQGEVKQM